MGWLDDLENDVEGALDSLSDVVNAIEDAIKSGAQIAGDVIDPVGAALQYVVNGVAYELFDLIGIHMRSLTVAEQNVLKGVFVNTVPVDKIIVTSIPGKDNRAFTIPGSMVISFAPFIPLAGPVIALSGLVLHLQDKYLINVGGMYSDQSLLPSTYDTNKHELKGSLLVHESTHVWQGVNGAFSWWYVFDSLYNQLQSGAHAYDVDETHLQTWDSYGVEQQAHLVEDWYSRGSTINDVCYPFIRDNIRPARPWAQTLFTVITTVFQAGAVSSATSNYAGPTATSGGPAVVGRPVNASAFRPGSVGLRGPR